MWWLMTTTIKIICINVIGDIKEKVLIPPNIVEALIGTTVHNLSTRVTKGIAALEKIIR